MELVAAVINLVGVILLSHAVYSAYEFSLLPNTPSPPVIKAIPALLDPKINLPLDIVLETIVSVLLLCLGVVLSSPKLEPIQWRVWAGMLERSKAARKMQDVGVGGNPYVSLDIRPGYRDIRAQRQEYQAWAEGKKEKKGQ
ncbi:hypothetical protein K470DRAFT_212195 [Piedraia hortae CBS 480.64]|uniref:Uncharacterized protein n=1 Tax=Piedraia hortae CBS 480.64 TaxID=1314780 RepID=A0A6A7C698_9PEZI|nr:hypothetical protein K470DRAFT_212195 [Piedraia hortae CBS 480.64]